MGEYYNNTTITEYYNNTKITEYYNNTTIIEYYNNTTITKSPVYMQILHNYTERY